jgi:hypothetical protein
MESGSLAVLDQTSNDVSALYSWVNLRGAKSKDFSARMTVMDYASGLPIAEDYTQLAGWARSIAALCTGAARGARWSEQ